MEAPGPYDFVSSADDVMLSTNDAFVNFSLKKKTTSEILPCVIIFVIVQYCCHVMVNVIITIMIHIPGDSPVCCIAGNIEDRIDEGSQPDQNVGGHMCLQSSNAQVEGFWGANMFTHAVPVVGADNKGWQDADEVAQKDGSHLDFQKALTGALCGLSGLAKQC